MPQFPHTHPVRLWALQKSLNPRPSSAFCAEKSCSLNGPLPQVFLYTAEPGCNSTLLDFTILYQQIFFTAAIFYCLATMRCLTPVFLHVEWLHSGWFIQHLLHSYRSYSTDLLWSSVRSATGLEASTWQLWTPHGPYLQGFQHHWKHSITFFFFLKQTTVFSIFLLNLAAWQVTSPTTNNWPSKTEAGMSSTHVTGMNPNGPVAPSQPNSRKQKWFPAPLEGTAGGSLCLHWFNESVKLQQGTRWQWW